MEPEEDTWKWMSTVVSAWVGAWIGLIVALLLLVQCGKTPTVTGPVPVTSPSPSPSPQPVLTAGLLHVEGHEFRNDRNETVYLLGGIPAGAPPSENGWPLTNALMLGDIAQAHLNFTHIRVGPFTETLPEGPVYDWTKPYVLDQAREQIRYAATLGIYVEVALFDHWCAQHDCGPFALDDYGREPDEAQLAWARKVVRSLGYYPNILWLDSNEAFKRPSAAWTQAILDAVRFEERANGFATHPFGTNSHDPAIERVVDYAERHTTVPQGHTGQPVMVNEYNDLTVEQVVERARQARDQETSFHFWRGDLNDRSAWLSGLRQLGDLRTGVTKKGCDFPWTDCQ